MKIFTEKGFREELAKRRKEREKEEYMAQKFKRLEEQIERLHIEIMGIMAKQEDEQRT